MRILQHLHALVTCVVWNLGLWKCSWKPGNYLTEERLNGLWILSCLSERLHFFTAYVKEDARFSGREHLYSGKAEWALHWIFMQATIHMDTFMTLKVQSQCTHGSLWKSTTWSWSCWSWWRSWRHLQRQDTFVQSSLPPCVVSLSSAFLMRPLPPRALLDYMYL